jgi:hypothetical protein
VLRVNPLGSLIVVVAIGDWMPNRGSARFTVVNSVPSGRVVLIESAASTVVVVASPAALVTIVL